ncbi:MAG: radical SAM protein [Rhodospirillales bacterium]|nr:radical SAM protein [Alphaproteobacteria bacterium]MBL6948108.1 radical SAM protein [Rhodospirillales bacterium]
MTDMPDTLFKPSPGIDPQKFRDPDFTAKGDQRAVVALTHLRTLWFNTGSLCNITCRNCYMDSSPTNNRLAYLTLADVEEYLSEIETEGLRVEEIAFTGGEPFMNRDLCDMIESALGKGYRVLVLTNAMKPLLNKRDRLLDIFRRYAEALTLRVSVDHFTPHRHEAVRGQDTWAPMIEGLKWLAGNGFKLTVAGRTCWNESQDQSRRGYADFFKAEGISIDAEDPAALVLFPEMDAAADVPEITTHCWDILGVAPESMMCATSRMIVKRRDGSGPVVVPCTLLPYDPAFELGRGLAQASKTVSLNHPHCAKFCVLGGASCSPD